MESNLLEEMRSHVVGPCNEAELNELNTLFPLIGEIVEPKEFWESDGFCGVRFNDVYGEWWTTVYQPTISFQDFKSKYIANATK